MPTPGVVLVPEVPDDNLADAAAAAPASSPACEKSAADKKLAGAAKKSHIKKCMADEAGAAKPAASASAAKK